MNTNLLSLITDLDPCPYTSFKKDETTTSYDSYGSQETIIPNLNIPYNVPIPMDLHSSLHACPIWHFDIKHNVSFHEESNHTKDKNPTEKQKHKHTTDTQKQKHTTDTQKHRNTENTHVPSTAPCSLLCNEIMTEYKKEHVKEPHDKHTLSTDNKVKFSEAKSSLVPKKSLGTEPEVLSCLKLLHKKEHENDQTAAFCSIC